jgi:transcription elongation factor GreA
MSQKQKVTQEGYDARVKEYKELQLAQEENVKAIQEARSQGDLSENADYDAARNAQAEIAAKLRLLEDFFKNAEIVNSEANSNFGKKIKIRFLDDNTEDEYQIVGISETDPLDHKISNESPLGKAILHASEGETVLVKTEDGDKFEVLILEIDREEDGKKKDKKSSTKKASSKKKNDK